MIRTIEEIPKEELQREAAFVAAVAEGLKRQPEGRIVMIDCPCGGKIMAIRSEYDGHRTTIAKCNSCRREVRGSSGALDAYERSGGR